FARELAIVRRRLPAVSARLAEQVTALAQALRRPGRPETADACCGVNACRTSGETAADPALTVAEATSAPGCGCRD
ncbi:hypothetical protein ACWDCB_41410, partial [Streptomyces sp. NPDC001178]